MGNSKYFRIKNGILLKYTGSGGDVVIPDGVTSIMPGTFLGHTGITSVTIPEGMTRIRGEAFRECGSLRSVTIPESVTVIGNWAFRGCTALTEVTIPAGVEHIEQEVFLDCTALESIHVAAGNKTYHDDDGVLMCENEIVCCPAGRRREYVLPDGAAIREGAFCGCERLRRIELPDEYATASQVMSVFAKREVGGTYQDTAVWLYLRGQLILSGESKKAVEDYIKRKKADYADGILKRGDAAAMENFLKLRKKVPAEELDELIQRSTEAGAAAVTAVLLEYKHKTYSPEELEKLQRDALDAPVRERTAGELLRLFSYSKSSEKITGYKGKDPVVVIPARIGSRRVRGIENTNIFTESCHQITEVTVSEGIESIGMYVFSGPHLVSVTLPTSVNRIHELAFTNCPNLTIHAPAGSYAERYAKKNSIPFEAI